MLPNISRYANVPFSYAELVSQLGDYRAPKNKVQDLERRGEIIRLKKGYYVAAANAAAPVVLELVANHLHGPSYVSLQTALRHYGLIPEHVVTVQSVTTGRTCEYANTLGRFTYAHVPAPYYALGITGKQSQGVYIQIATPEKALCDLLVLTSGLRLRSLRAAREFLEDYLRFDMEAFYRMNAGLFRACAAVSKKSDTLLNIANLLERR